MQCNRCNKSGISQSATNKGYVLSYQRCNGCGRQDGYELTAKDSDHVIAKGEEARKMYLAHVENSAKVEKTATSGDSPTPYTPRLL